MSADTAPDAASRCPVCGAPVDPGVAIACSNCATPHHPDCWDYHGGCSMFGCGSRETIDLELVRATLESRELTITEQTRAPVRWDAVAQGLARRFRDRARFLPRTVTAGLAGAAVSVACYLMFLPAQGDPYLLYLSIFLTGGLYGVLAPFLAPSQVRTPGRWTAAGLAGFAGLYVFGEWLRVSGDWALALVVPLFFSAFLFSSSIAEWAAGARTRLGERLGRLALPARLAIGWAAAVALMVGTLIWDRGGSLPRLWVVYEIGIWGLLAVGTTMPAIEQGKAGAMDALPEETGPRGLPEA